MHAIWTIFWLPEELRCAAVAKIVNTNSYKKTLFFFLPRLTTLFHSLLWLTGLNGDLIVALSNQLQGKIAYTMDNNDKDVWVIGIDQ